MDAETISNLRTNVTLINAEISPPEAPLCAGGLSCCLKSMILKLKRRFKTFSHPRHSRSNLEQLVQKELGHALFLKIGLHQQQPLSLCHPVRWHRFQGSAQPQSVIRLGFWTNRWDRSLPLSTLCKWVRIFDRWALSSRAHSFLHLSNYLFVHRKCVIFCGLKHSHSNTFSVLSQVSSKFCISCTDTYRRYI